MTPITEESSPKPLLLHMLKFHPPLNTSKAVRLKRCFPNIMHTILKIFYFFFYTST